MRVNLFSSIGGKILLLILILLVSGTSLPIAISYFSSNRTILKTTVKNVHEINQISNRQLETWIDSRKTDIHALSLFKSFQVSLQDNFIGKSARLSAKAISGTGIPKTAS